MNLIQQAEHLKNLPDQALSQMTQGLSSTPPYLVVAEMQRRESMRKSYQAQNDPVQGRTVVEEMRDRFNPAPPPMPQGMPQGAPQQGQQPMPGMPPMRMREGGLASLKGYFDQMQGEGGGGLQALMGMPPVDESMANPRFPGAPPMGTFDDEPAMNSAQLDSRYGATPSIQEVMEVVKSLRGKSRLEGIADELAAQEKNYRSKKPKLGETLMQLGLGMAASRRPDFAGAVGEGGLHALQGYQQQRELNTGRADATMRQRLGVAEAEQRSDDVATREAGELHRANMSGRNTAIMTGENARRGMQADKSREKINEATRASQAEIEGMKEAAAERRYRETGAATSAEKQKDREADDARLEREIKAGKFRDHSGGGGGEKLSPLLGYSKDMLRDIESEILHLRPMMDSVMSDAEKKAIGARMDELRRKKEYWRGVSLKEIKRTMPNADMSALDDRPAGPVAAGADVQFIFDPTTGDLVKNSAFKAAEAAPARDYSKAREAAGAAVMGGLRGLMNPPGLQSLIGAAAASAKRLKEPYSPPHPNY